MNRAFQYRAASSYDEALGWLAELGPQGRVLAGGTDLLINIRAGLMRPETVIDIKRIPNIDQLSDSPTEGLVIGAGVTINELLEREEVIQHYPLLTACAEHLASHQVRNRATVVGNIVNASPCADMAPGLLCLDASIEVRSQAGPRTVPAHTFFTGAKQTILKPGELVSRILIPATTRDAQGGYLKLKRIAGHDLGIVGAALLKHGDLIRVAVSSAAPTPVRVRDFSTADSLDTVIAETQAAICPIDDVRCTKEYRLFMVGVFLKRLWQEVVA